jgi:hypothetical protein
MDISAAVKTALEDAVKTGPAQATTRSAAMKAALDENRALIVKAIGQGYSATGLAKKLKASGISASIESLRQSIQAIATTSNGTNSKSAKARSAKAPTPAPSATSTRGPRSKENKAFEAEDRTA